MGIAEKVVVGGCCFRRRFLRKVVEGLHRVMEGCEGVLRRRVAEEGCGGGLRRRVAE